MSLILADAGHSGFYLLSVPERVAHDLDKYKSDFYAWLNDGDEGHGFRQDVNARKRGFDGKPLWGIYYYGGYEDRSGAAVFVRWLNNVVLKDSGEKAVILPRMELY